MFRIFKNIILLVILEKGDLIILLSQILSLEVLKSKKLISYLKSSIFAIFFKK